MWKWIFKLSSNIEEIICTWIIWPQLYGLNSNYYLIFFSFFFFMITKLLLFGFLRNYTPFQICNKQINYINCLLLWFTHFFDYITIQILWMQYMWHYNNVTINTFDLFVKDGLLIGLTLCIESFFFFFLKINKSSQKELKLNIYEMICTQMGMSEGKERKIYCDILCVGADLNVRLFGISLNVRIRIKN